MSVSIKAGPTSSEMRSLLTGIKLQLGIHGAEMYHDDNAVTVKIGEEEFCFNEESDLDEIPEVTMWRRRL